MIPFREMRLRYAADEDGDIVDINDIDPRQKRGNSRFVCPGCGTKVIPAFSDDKPPHFYHAPLPGEIPKCQLRSYLVKSARLLLFQSLRSMVSEQDQVILSIQNGQRVRLVDYLGRTARPRHETYEMRLLDGVREVNFMPIVNGFTYDVGLVRDGGDMLFRISVDERLSKNIIAGGPQTVEFDIANEGDVERMAYAILSGHVSGQETSLITWNIVSPPEITEDLPLPGLEDLRTDICELMCHRLRQGGFTMPVPLAVGGFRIVDITAGMEMVSAFSTKTRGIYLVYPGRAHLGIIPVFSSEEAAEVSERHADGPPTAVLRFPEDVDKAILHLRDMFMAGGLPAKSVSLNVAAIETYRDDPSERTIEHATGMVLSLAGMAARGEAFPVTLKNGLHRISAVQGETGDADLVIDLLDGIDSVMSLEPKEGSDAISIGLFRDGTLRFHVTLSASLGVVSPGLGVPGLILSYRYGQDREEGAASIPEIGKSGLYRLSLDGIRPRVMTGLSVAVRNAAQTVGVRVIDAGGRDVAMIPIGTEPSKVRDVAGEDMMFGDVRLVLSTDTASPDPDSRRTVTVIWDGVALPQAVIDGLSSGEIRESQGVILEGFPAPAKRDAVKVETPPARVPDRSSERRFTVSQSKDGAITITRDGKVYGRWVGEIGMPGHMNDLEVLDTIARGRSIQIADPKSCLVCKHHGFGTFSGGRPIHCRLRKMSCRQNEARNCRDFRRVLRDEEIQEMRVAAAGREEATDLDKKMAFYRVDGS